jgi:hypothetical protein
MLYGENQVSTATSIFGVSSAKKVINALVEQWNYFDKTKMKAPTDSIEEKTADLEKKTTQALIFYAKTQGISIPRSEEQSSICKKPPRVSVTDRDKKYLIAEDENIYRSVTSAIE